LCLISMDFRESDTEKAARVWFIFGVTVSLASCAEGNSLVLYWSPYPMGSSYCCYGEENNTYFEPRGENVIADIPQNVFSLSCAFGAGDPNAEWVFIILTVDELGVELSRSNYAGERDFPWIFP